MSNINPHALLFENLVILQELKPGGAEFSKCMKEDMFTKPNRTAFDQVLFYLCNAYDSARYMPKVPWPILDRSQERTFRQNTVVFVKEVIKENPEARLPPFSPSFLSTPGGDRLAKFMWKFSLLVLKTVLSKDSDVVLLHYPTAGLDIIENITESNLQELAEETDSLSQLIIDASVHAKKLINDHANYAMEIKSLRKELSELVEGLEHCPLSESEKLMLLSDDREQFMSVATKWQDFLDKETQAAKVMLKSFQDKSDILRQCYGNVKMLVDSKTLPIVLDANNFPSNLKDGNGKLDLAHLLSLASNAASTLLSSISIYGGFQSNNQILPELEHICEQLREIHSSLTVTKAGFIDLISASLDTMKSPKSFDDQPHSPVVKRGLLIGQEMLQDAQLDTPPLTFDIHCDVSSRISAKTPPVHGLIGRMKSQRSNNSQGDNVSVGTPKTSLSNSKSGLVSRNLSGKISHSKAFPQKIHKNLRSPIPSATVFETTVPQTPANFCPNQFATSTVCKPVTSAVNGNKSSCSLSVPKISSRISEGKNTLQKMALPKSKEVSKSSAASKEPPVHALLATGKGRLLPLAVNKESGSIIDSKLTSSTQSVHNDGLGLPDKSKFLVQDDIVPCALQQPSLPEPSLPLTTSLKKDFSLIKNTSKPSQTLPTPRGMVSTAPSPQLMKTLSGSPSLNPVLVSEHNHSSKKGTPKIVVTSEAHQDMLFNSPKDRTFDSPQSSSFGVFSPPSANNSFFSSDSQLDNAVGVIPRFDLDFGDEISPSGRVSLCPPSHSEEPVAVDVPASQPKENAAPEVPAKAGRKSLLEVISRYRELVASSKHHETIVVSPPSSPEPDLSEEDFNVEIDLNLEHLNLV